jgi:hypothetical protein
LRTDEHPNGVTKLSYINRIRVLQANSIYHFITAAAEFCLDHGKLVCIENPRSSLYWKTTFFQPLVNRLKFTAHQACAYGSSRPKWTALAHNTTTLLKFNHVCPGIGALHKHKPWGVVNGPAGRKFSTAEETAYPLALAYRIAYSLAQELVLRGWNPPPVAFCPPDEVSYQYLRSVVGVQPKSSKIAPLVSEFRQILCIHVPVDCAVPIPRTSCNRPGLTFHQGLVFSKNLPSGQMGVLPVTPSLVIMVTNPIVLIMVPNPIVPPR